jgi:hypothetical protein
MNKSEAMRFCDSYCFLQDVSGEGACCDMGVYFAKPRVLESQVSDCPPFERL